jgi:hypothetical protein
MGTAGGEPARKGRAAARLLAATGREIPRLGLQWRLGRLLIILGAPRRKAMPPTAGVAPAQSEQSRSAALFDIYTFVTDDGDYAEMCDSFTTAGFTQEIATYIRLSDAATGADPSDPFAAIGYIADRLDASYAVLCHQDVRIDQGPGADELNQLLADLSTRDPDWVVAGNAGATDRMRAMRRLVDPHGGSTDDPLPAEVISLDENFLVFNRGQRPRTSTGMYGFHLYGTDVCLNARASGGSAYIIDFPLTHLSGGALDDGGYEEAKARFLEIWNGRCAFRYVRTPVEILFMSRYGVLRRLFASSRAREWVELAGNRESATPWVPR